MDQSTATRIRALLATLALALTTLAGVASSPMRASAEAVQEPGGLQGCAVEGASLTWGFKESFRAYIDGAIANGEWEVSDGATYATPDFGWSKGTGVYDADTASGQVGFAGTVRFTGHGGLLDTTISDPRLRFVDADTAYLLLDVAGVTMADAMAGKTADPIVTEAVPFVELDLSGGAVALSSDGATLTGTDVPASITTQGYEAFPNYKTGTAFDPVSFTLVLGGDCASPAASPSISSSPAVTDGPAAPPEADGMDLAWAGWTGGGLLAAALVAAAILLVRRRGQE